MKPLNLIALSLTLALLGAGCSQGTPELSKEDASKMKGGPMPADTWQKMAETRKKWAAEHPSPGTTGPQSSSTN